MLRAPTTAWRTVSLGSMRWASTLVVVEHNNKAIPATMLSAFTAASKIGGDVTALVAGKGVADVAKQVAAVKGVKQVLVADDAAFDHFIAEPMAALVTATQKAGKYTHVLSLASGFGKNILPRVSAQLDVQAITDVTDIKGEDTFVRPIYAGNALCTVKSKDSVKVITVRATAFPKAATGGSASSGTAAKDASVDSASKLSSFVSAEVKQSARPELTAASIIICGGRGMKGAEHFKMLEELADKLGGAVGASRAAVEAGWGIPNDWQIGQTGKIVAPDLYLGAGVSGAIQHLAGMKDSKVIVCINKDPEAPMFQVADYGLVADLFKAVPEINAILKK